MEREGTLLGRLFLERGRRNLAAAVRGEPGAAAFEEAIRQARRVEERSIDVRLGRVQEDDQVEAVAHVPVDATDAVAHGTPARKRRRVVKGSSAERILWAGMSVRFDGATPAPRHGTADRRGTDDDPVPPRRDRVAAEASETGEAVRRVGPAHRYALQRPRAGAVQAVLLQEVPRVPP